MAKTIIEAPNTCNQCREMGLACGMAHKDSDNSRNPKCPLTIIPDNATNKEVFSKVFCQEINTFTCPVYCMTGKKYICSAYKDNCRGGEWWDAPYKGGKNDQA